MPHLKGKKKPSKFFFQPSGVDEISNKPCVNHSASLDETDHKHPFKCFHCGKVMTEEDYELFFKQNGYRLKKKRFAKKWDHRKVGKPVNSFDQLLEGYTY